MDEFMEFMSRYGDERLSDPDFFMELDRDRNGVLDFWEVITLYYIIKSGRPFCDSCDRFIKAVYYSCVGCFHHPDGPFNLCSACYRNGDYHHDHNGRVQFLDNFTLLEVKRQSSTTSSRPPMDQGRAHSYRRAPSRANSRTQSGSFNHSNAIVPARRRDRWHELLQAMEMGVSVGNIATTLCTIL